MSSETPPVKIGEVLTQCGLITPEQLDRALAFARQERIRLGESLVQLGIIDEDRLTWALGLQLDLSYVDLQPDIIDWNLLNESSLSQLYELSLVPLSRVDGEVTVVTSEPAREGLVHSVAEMFPHDRVKIQIASEEAILQILNEAERLASADERRMSGESARPDDFYAALDMGQATHYYVLRAAGDQYGRIGGDGASLGAKPTMSPAAMVRLADSLTREFIELYRFGGGSCSLRPADDVQGLRALRAVMVTGISGWIAAITKVPESLDTSQLHPVYAIQSANPVAGKIALLEALGRKDSTQAPSLSLEIRADILTRTVFQAGLPESHERMALCCHLLEMVRPAAILLEMETLAAAAQIFATPRHSDAGPLFVVVRTPALQPATDVFPPHVTKVYLPAEAGLLRDKIQQLVSEIN